MALYYRTHMHCVQVSAHTVLFQAPHAVTDGDLPSCLARSKYYSLHI